MSKIVRYRFMGSWISFWLHHRVTIAALYLLTGTVRLDTDVDNPEELAQELYVRKRASPVTS